MIIKIFEMSFISFERCRFFSAICLRIFKRSNKEKAVRPRTHTALLQELKWKKKRVQKRRVFHKIVNVFFLTQKDKGKL